MTRIRHAYDDVVRFDVDPAEESHAALVDALEAADGAPWPDEPPKDMSEWPELPWFTDEVVEPVGMTREEAWERTARAWYRRAVVYQGAAWAANRRAERAEARLAGLEST